MKINWVKHKRRFDRGGQYQGYYSAIALSLILIKSFKVEGLHWYLIAIFGVIILRYLAGLFDDKYILAKEQRQYFTKNPVINDMNRKLDKLLKLPDNEKSECNNPDL